MIDFKHTYLSAPFVVTGNVGLDIHMCPCETSPSQGDHSVPQRIEDSSMSTSSTKQEIEGPS